MKCENCGRTIRPKKLEAMKDKDGRMFCDVDCACDFYIDTMRLAIVEWGKDDIEGDTHDNNT